MRGIRTREREREREEEVGEGVRKELSEMVLRRGDKERSGKKGREELKKRGRKRMGGRDGQDKREMERK